MEFTKYELLLVAKYYDDIKDNYAHWKAYLKLPHYILQRIRKYRTLLNHLDEYKTAYPEICMSNTDLINVCNIDKLKIYFNEED